MESILFAWSERDIGYINYKVTENFAQYTLEIHTLLHCVDVSNEFNTCFPNTDKFCCFYPLIPYICFVAFILLSPILINPLTI